MPPNWPTYAWYTAAALLGIAGTFLLIKWLIGDRSKGRRRCPKCWYDMSATAARLCPECGTQSAAESHLFRSRRSRAALITSILCIAGAIVANTVVRGASNGWLGLIPTTVLMYLAPDPLAEPKTNRPALLGSQFAPPVTPMPTNFAEELRRRCIDGPIADWQYRSIAMRYLRSIKPGDYILAPDVIPAGENLCIQVDNSFLQNPFGSTGPLFSIILDAQPRQIGSLTISEAAWLPASSITSTGVVPESIDSITFDVSLELQPTWMKAPFVITLPDWTLPVRVVNDGQCPDDPGKTEFVRNGLMIAIQPPTSTSPLLLQAQTRYVPQPKVCLGNMEINILLLDGDRVVSKSQFVYGLPTNVTLRCSDADRERLLQANGDWNTEFINTLTLRIFGNERLNPCGRVCCWRGSYTIPFSTCLVHPEESTR